jgi:hypothetical protein
MKAAVLTILCIVVYALHQDFWFWKTHEPMLFGILPIGLAYHAGFCFLCALLMFILVKFAWPSHLESVEAAHDKTEAPKS